MAQITFEGTPSKIGSWFVLRIPKDASAKLPSRGLTMVTGTLNGHRFRTTLEPDGKGSHWFRIDSAMQKNTGANAGNSVTVVIEPTDDWIEPEVPADLREKLRQTPQAFTMWRNVTPNARWDWIRWIRSTKNAETRKRRIEVALDKLKKGTRRPCCFNRNICSESDVSHNWILIDPTR